MKPAPYGLKALGPDASPSAAALAEFEISGALYDAALAISRSDVEVPDISAAIKITRARLAKASAALVAAILAPSP